MMDEGEANKTTEYMGNNPSDPVFNIPYYVTLVVKGQVIIMVKIQNIFTTIDLSSNKF